MGNEIGNAVNNAITRELFQATLKANGIKADSDKFKKALTIFDNYAKIGGDANTLEEDEQVMARADFDRLTKEDYKEGTSNFGKDKGAAEEYMKAMNHAASNSGPDKAVGDITLTGDGAVVTYGAETEDTSDDVVTIYTKGADGKYTKSEIEPETEEAPTDPAQDSGSNPEQPSLQFGGTDALKKSVVRYLLNMGEDEAVSPELLNGDIECSVDSNGKATVKFGGKEYTARVNADGKTVFENDEEKTTLQQAVLDSKSTDAENHYYNRGRKGNLKSTYDAEKGEITNNSGAGRQGVSQVQTFSSMLMNNNEGTTLKLDGQIQEDGTRKALDGETIINSIDTSDDGSKGEITKSELIKYLSAAVKEANVTVDAAKPGAPVGSRIYAPNVDLDLKDLANIGIVFDKYDKNGNGKLNADELNKLLNDLKSGQSMSKLAKEADKGKYEYSRPEKSPEKKPDKPKDDKPLEFKYGDVAKIDKTRKNTEGGSVAYQYSGGTKGMRTMVADDGTGTTRTVTNANIAEYDDHGILDAGKKEFIVIYGLEPNVRAEVVSGEAKGPMVIEVKDSKGNKTYRQVSYDEKTHQYSQKETVYRNKAGEYRTAKQRKADGLKSLNLPEGSKLPKDFSFDYDKKGELVCKFKGKVVDAKVAKVMIMKANATKPKKDDK